MPYPQCAAITKRGTQCPNRVMPGKDKCFSHDPDLADTRARAHSQGGRNKATERRVAKRVPDDIKATIQTLFRTLQGLEDGTVEASQANAIANVSRAIVGAWETGMVESKLKELEDRIESKSTGTVGTGRAA